jgi:hypothetical protein
LCSSAAVNELNTVLGHRYYLVAEPGQDVLKEVPHLRFIVGDGDSKSSWH